MTIRSAFALLMLIVALSAATPTSASAQIGVLVGFNSAKINFEGDAEDESANDFISRRTGFVGGVTFNIPIQDVFSVEADALVGLKGAKFDFEGEDSESIKLTYLDIPVMGRVNIPGTPNTGLHLLFGPSFNFKLSEKFEPETGNDADEVENFETSFVVGVGVTVARFRIDGRYGFGLTNIDKLADGGSGVKNKLFSLLFGFEL